MRLWLDAASVAHLREMEATLSGNADTPTA
jgi:hypothetical protein